MAQQVYPKSSRLSASVEWQTSVLDKDLDTPPGSPTVGARYIVAAGGTGAWLSQDEKIAEWDGSEWTFFTPTEGTAAYVEDENTLYVYDGAHNSGSWVQFASVFDHGTLSGLADDDHPQYQLLTGKDAASGYAGLQSNSGFTRLPLQFTSRTGAVTLTTSSPTVNPCNAAGGAFAVTLPAATALANSAGVAFYIIKTDSSSNAVTITAGGSDTISGAASIALSQQYQFVLIYAAGNSNIWHVLSQGVASTNGTAAVPSLAADPSAVAGGLYYHTGTSRLRRSTGASWATLEQTDQKDAASGYAGLNASKQLTFLNLQATTRSATASLVVTSPTVSKCDATSGAFTLTLPAANGQAGLTFIIKKTDSSGNAITIARAGSDTIDGATSYDLSTQYQSVTLVSDGSAMWMVV